MKKRLSALLCIFLLLSLIGTTGVYAQEDQTVAADAPQIIELDSVCVDTAPVCDSYTIVDDGETLLEVVHVKEPGMTAALNNAAANGFYTAQFMIPETNDEVFLTGLTQDNTDEIFQAIVAHYVDSNEFELSDLGFIDAEKAEYDENDDSLCWAAATSNLLTYTGWAAQANFDSTDSLFEAFIDAFEDKANSVCYAAGWFFNGVAGSNDAAQPTAGTGAYLPQYYYGDMVDVVYLDANPAENYSIVYDRMRDGYGVSLSLDIYGDDGYEGGHSVSCWGFITDIRYPAYDKRHYKNVFVTDSDSDKYDIVEGKDRRDAPDVMSVCALHAEEQESFDGYTYEITYCQTAVISEAITMRPYSADLPRETSPNATYDMTTTADISIDPFFLTDDSAVEQTKTVFTPGSAIWYQPYMMNISNVTYTGPLNLVVSVTDANGAEQYRRTFNTGSYSIYPSKGAGYAMTRITKTLPVGDYTITASFNQAQTVTEAYFFNNSKSIDFKVRETYLLGDVDSDGSVSIIDATYAQRIMAGLSANTDDTVVERGDINENGVLDILDATIVQRYLSSDAPPVAYTKINTQQFYS